MSIQERKLSFYFLGMEIKDNDGETVNSFSYDKLETFCNYVATLDSASKVIDIRRANKVVELKTLELYNKQGIKFLKGLILSGKYNHSPDYLSRENGTLRESDKQMYEAFAEKTHFLGSVNAEGVELLFESRQAGAGIGMVVKCLNKIWNSTPGSDGYFYYHPIAVDNLEAAIRNLNRIKIGKIYYDKTYFAADNNALGKMQGLNSLQDDVILTIRAKRSQTISKRSMLDFLRSMAAEDSKISRIRLEGNNETGNTIIDTYLTKKINNVNVELDNKGLVDDHSIFARMEEVFGISE